MLNRAAVIKRGLGRFATVGAYIFFVISIVLAFTLYSRSLHEVCVQSNKDRTGIVGFVDSAVKRSTLTAEATLAAKTSTPQEKAAAVKNLATLKAFSAGLHESLPQQDCPSGWLP